MTVVNITVDPIAGSIFSFSKTKGINAPKSPALKRFIIIEAAITKPKRGILNHKYATTPITNANNKPFAKEIITSL